MKLSDFVARYLADQGIRHVFAISGGASIHLIHSLEDTPNITFICPQHEQAGAMAADAYARVTGNLGAAIATSGPGATNMITGICCAYFDSVPVIYITGQVTTFRLRRDSGVRQLGFQETDTTDICRSFTKYAVRIDQPEKILYELEKATHIAKTGRPGPVLLDIPDDVVRADIEPDQLESYVPGNDSTTQCSAQRLQEDLDKSIRLINAARRPALIIGWGVRLAHAEAEVSRLVDMLQFPVLPTWAARDMFPEDHPLLVGPFGTHGTRYGNFVVQNADLVLVIGARLDTREAGSPITSFAREARKIVVDIDINELNKFERLGMDVDVAIHSDAKSFLTAIGRRHSEISVQDISEWRSVVNKWKEEFSICPPEFWDEEKVNPYVFVKVLSHESAEGDLIIVDTGCAIAWMMQAFEFKRDQRLFHDFNNTAMGYALPASIGACFAIDKGPVTCVVGDGSLLMNIQELATVVRHELPIKIFLLNNQGHSMIQQTQDQWLGSRYLASSVKGGLAFPDFVRVAEAYGFETLTIKHNGELSEKIRKVLDCEGPILCNVEIPSEHRVLPQARFGRPIEDSEPLLDRSKFLDCMFVKPLEVSLKGE